MIVAKTVIPNQFWILRQGDRKVGNIEAEAGGFTVKINDRTEKFSSIKTIKQRVAIDFEKPQTTVTALPKNDKLVYGYPTTGRAHNPIYDVKHQVPLWTKEPRSKSWYAAGWYRIKQGRRWTIVQCPKLIVLDRYTYHGPFHTKFQAEEHEFTHQ